MDYQKKYIQLLEKTNKEQSQIIKKLLQTDNRQTPRPDKQTPRPDKTERKFDIGEMKQQPTRNSRTSETVDKLNKLLNVLS